MKLYGVKYTSFIDGNVSWVDQDIYKSLISATSLADTKAAEAVAEYDDDGFRLLAERTAALTAMYKIVNPAGVVLEQFEVVEFNVIDGIGA